MQVIDIVVGEMGWVDRGAQSPQTFRAGGVLGEMLENLNSIY